MWGLHNIGITSETPIDHSKVKTYFDVTKLLVEGVEECKNKDYFESIWDL